MDYYESGILHKDPAQITLGLRDIGVETVFIARNFVSQSDFLQAPFPLMASAAIEDPMFWRTVPVDAVLLISRLCPDAEKIVWAVNAAGLRLILKADGDGTLGYPLTPNYLRTLSWRSNPVRTLLRYVKWRLPTRRYVGKKIDQIAIADAIIVESPKARSNILAILKYWKCEDLSLKIHFVPNPVANDVVSITTSSEKIKIVMAIGRWDDDGPKNTAVMVRSIVEFLRIRNDYKAIIIGPGTKVVNSILKKFSGDFRSRLSVLGSMDHSLLAQRLAEAQILFMPSRMESFGLVAAEALSVGCSIAVTPVESLDFLTAEGFSGTVASGFDTRAAKDALVVESKRWDANEHSPSEIAEYWRARLDRRTIAAKIRAIAEAPDSGAL
jgi:glycosyltransferase involved in cell wall biosynthesis